MSTGRRQVVLVEDDMGMAEAIQRVLTNSGFDVTSFESAEAALQDHRTMDARCLVLDIHMPGVSGFQLYERLLASGRKPAVVFITARDHVSHRDRASQLGALGFFLKPFSIHELGAVISKAFE